MIRIIIVDLYVDLLMIRIIEFQNNAFYNVIFFIFSLNFEILSLKYNL